MHDDDPRQPTSGGGKDDTPDANGHEVAEAPTARNGSETEIMSNLPRTRPARRSSRREPVGGVKVAKATAKPAAARPARQAKPRAATTAPKAAPKAAPEPAPGLASLAIGGAVAAAKLPIKVGAQITFRALDTVARELRSR